MLSMNDLSRGTLFILDGAPFEVLEISHSHIGRGGSNTTARVRNAKTGQVYTRTFKQSDTFAEADIEKRPISFLYSHRNEYIFIDPKDRSKRFPISLEILGDKTMWLKPDMELTGVFLSDSSTGSPQAEIISIILPIKLDLKVTEAPPGLRGDTAQGGTKLATLETGAKVSVPLFINQDDVVRINTESGEYTERVIKA
ncbi:MAG: hypothetical protein A3H71_02760 [Candidatus Sungbacteria bacterium RIFCSPLOWO2_02_FULL_48_13b]|uniref:Elongation factor P C-terminal domain-containing protein n=1 Tax=Candidatus Sungbacteria bacterium RIFCSPLOWO2_02_FULL_48_13b TaxID=1802283 RepID=A0A1G2LJ63_9BACT|nr:MAG: hypothetical protein A3H71_02760 [Candidatus Sungbacteria bacterium RIFCSPLOWO2_02_FULL_48_13b]